MKRISLRITDSEWKAYHEKATRAGVTLNFWIRRTLNMFRGIRQNPIKLPNQRGK